MLKLIFQGFTSNKAGKLYLISIAILIFSNIITSANTNLYIISTISVIIYFIALIYYTKYLKTNIWIIVFLVILSLFPMGIWMTVFYFARQNYIIQNQKID